MSLSAGAIVGIVLGALLLVLVVAYLIYTYWWLRNRNTRSNKTFSTAESQELEEYVHTNQRAAKLMAAYDDSEIADYESDYAGDTTDNDDYNMTIQQNDPQEYFDNMAEQT